MNFPEVAEDGRYRVVRVAPEEGRRLPDDTRGLVLRRDRYRCVFCGKGGLLEVDHIVPWSAGGSDDMDNLRTLCRPCNQDRSNFKVPADDERRLPNGIECVYCTPHLVGETDVTPIYCVQCNKRAPGVPEDPSWHPDVARAPAVFDVPDEAEVEVARRERTARLVAYQRSAGPPLWRTAADLDGDDA